LSLNSQKIHFGVPNFRIDYTRVYIWQNTSRPTTMALSDTSTSNCAKVQRQAQLWAGRESQFALSGSTR